MLGPRLVWGLRSGPLRHGRMRGTREPPKPSDGFCFPRRTRSGAETWLSGQAVCVCDQQWASAARLEEVSLERYPHPHSPVALQPDHRKQHLSSMTSAESVYEPAQLDRSAWEGGKPGLGLGSVLCTSDRLRGSLADGHGWRLPTLPFQPLCGQWRTQCSMVPFWKTLGDDAHHSPLNLPQPDVPLGSILPPTDLPGADKRWEEWTRLEMGRECMPEARPFLS